MLVEYSMGVPLVTRLEETRPAAHDAQAVARPTLASPDMRNLRHRTAVCFRGIHLFRVGLVEAAARVVRRVPGLAEESASGQVRVSERLAGAAGPL